MRKVAAIAAAALALTFWPIIGSAADLSKPATIEQIMALPNAKAATCHVEASATGVVLRDDREAQFGAGVGCDVILANLLLGGGIRGDFADWRNTASIFAKVGLVVNSGAHLYAVGEWKVPELKIKEAGQLAVGAGAELKLEFINKNFWLFGETTITATKFGALATKDDWTNRVGVRFGF